METSIQKRRVISCNDKLWHYITYIEVNTDLKQSEIMRRLLKFISENYDQVELLKNLKRVDLK
ncbi:hypothetical protein HN953_02760 [Candidatus Woesearchaeota archaeon]|jgi:hypothetical protein|nr:hypothetical protein [Candidatus Woesearchaeota archaeon]